jgi:hypothetical protein
MGFNKRYVNYQNSLVALESKKLKEFYGKTDAFIFQDYESEKVYKLFVEGKTEEEIIKLMNQ